MTLPPDAGRELAASGRNFAAGPYPLLVLGVTLLALALAVWGLHAWRGGRADRVALVERLAAEAGGGTGTAAVPFAALDRRVRRYAWGRRLAGRLAATGTNLTPGQFTASVIGLVVGSWAAAAVLLAPFFGPIAALIAGWAAYSFLEWRRRIRTERFIAQLPDLARVLANATQAGLALRTAVSMAAEELDAPAGEELKQVADAMAVGHSIDDALGELQQRLPSRELIVLVSTLVLSSRAGGSVVESLRNLTVTLEERKETRREIRTQMSQVTVTAYAVPVIGLGSLFLLDRIMPGSLSAMTGSTVGRICVLISLGLYALGFALIRRMSRIDV
ncbi:type II secretion system F family protein [Streptomyces cocklensis]|uniref:Tight adherence protein B n=1 Tax=Actinacidiphila cocklensis TaxID=887465 RepID=A0A9W4GRW0_9ACTN|nr:type II secretion system F family protein [Actinacidiphila cocklensis]MDD1062882.1 type II secretion system F family protein [Actinacidiphila cocklensis]CAG6394143.1 Tight adherence protein B [Actinacidiphila cocklensis]